jgi:hypothetical protein
VIAFAIRLNKIRSLSNKEFNAAMRKEFPAITPYTLRMAYKDSRILIAIQTVSRRVISE